MKLEGTTLVVVNSVCGAARNARREQKMSLEGVKTRPFNHCFLQELTKMQLMLQDNTFPFPPSSPSMALFKNGD
jgi:putative YphP/YqiW family bacilliredoxin